MSSITAIGSASEYAPNRSEEPRITEEPTVDLTADQTKVPVVEAHVEHQDFKTTIQGFQYTGKGSFIDKIF